MTEDRITVTGCEKRSRLASIIESVAHQNE